MAFYGTGVEYGLHCLVWLATGQSGPASSRELADLQGVSPTYVAKIFPRLEKAGLVVACDGIQGGYRLARAAGRISVLDVVDAIEGGKALFDCQEVRGRCALFDGRPPAWSTAGVCGIHAVMIRAEQAMRHELARTTLGDLADTVLRKAPAGFPDAVRSWLSAHFTGRRADGGREAVE